MELRHRTSYFEKGITLIALVVTIIVLLILAGLTMTLVLGQDGLFTKVDDSKIASEMAEIKEQAEMVKADLIIKKRGESPEKLELVNEISQADYFNGSTVNKNIVTTKDDKYDIAVKNNLEIVVGKKGQVEGDLVETINADMDGLPDKKTAEELLDYIPIYTVQHLKDIASEETNYQIQDLNGTNKGTYTMAKDAKYALMNDIDLSSESNFPPIDGFTGELEGNGCIISNMNIDRTSEGKTFNRIVANHDEIYPPAGLFEYVKDGTIKNLAIVGANVIANESVGAIAGQGDNITIDNCYIKDSTLTRNTSSIGDSSGCVIGYIGDSGANVTNCKVISSYCPNGAGSGFCGGTNGRVYFSNCSVMSEKNDVVYASGILHCAFAEATFDNCHIQDVSITDGGIISWANKYPSNGQEMIKLNNCSAKKITLIGSRSYPGGGSSAMVAGSYFPVKIENCNVEECNVNLNSGTNPSGIIMSYVYKGSNNNSKSEIINCNVRDIKCTSAPSTLAGIVDYVYAELDIKNCKVDNIQFESKVFDFGGICTYIGAYQGEGVLIENCKVSNVKATIEPEPETGYSRSRSFAGIVNCTWGSTKIKKCDVSNLEVIGNTAVNSGIVGIDRANSNGVISECTVNNFKVTNNYDEKISQFTVTGGITGEQYVPVEKCKVNNFIVDVKANWVGGITAERQMGKPISECEVTNTNLSNKNGHTGGICGYSQSSTSISDCNVENLTLHSEQNGSVGGINALTVSDVLISDCDLKNVNISNTGNGCIGGVSGFGATVEKCNIDGLQINANSTSGIGGITGCSPYKLIKKCNLINGIINANMRAGGISGAASRSISECTVSDTTITATGSEVGGIQGYGGDEGGAIIDKCEVNNVTLNGASDVNPIQGKNAPSGDTITNCKRDGVAVTQ